MKNLKKSCDNFVLSLTLKENLTLLYLFIGKYRLASNENNCGIHYHVIFFFGLQCGKDKSEKYLYSLQA